MRKPLAGGLLLLALLALSCRKTPKNDEWYSTVSQYVYAYTSGAIGRDDAIRVRFVNPAVGNDKIGQAVPKDVFSIKPAIGGQAVWEDERTILLVPSEPLAYGSHYTGNVALDKLFPDVPKIARIFEFEFSVRELSFDVLVEGVRTDDPADYRKQQIIGHVTFSDAVDQTLVEKMLVAKQGSQTLNQQWTHDAAGLVHQFKIAGVERVNVPGKVELRWNGEGFGLKKTGSFEQKIPSLDEFTVMSARVVQGEEQYIALNFSDPLSPAQVLDGLIAFDGNTSALRFAIDGNFVRVYPSGRLSGELNLRVEPGIKNTLGASMQGRSDWPLNFEDLKPAVRLVGRGAIIPQNGDGSIVFPFEAVGLTAVDVEVFKVFNSNILQFLQVNELEGEQELDRVGKIILQKKITLHDLNPDASAQVWQRYALDLKDIIKQDPGALYQVRLAFRKGYTRFPCQTGDEAGDDDGLAHLGQPDEFGVLNSIMGSYRGVYWQDSDEWWSEEDDYDWASRDNPCFREYYNSEHFTQRNVFVSDLGITAKRGLDNSLFVAVTNLLTTEPVGGVDIELFNYQLQLITKLRTDGSGIAQIDGLREIPFVAVAKRGDRRGYLRMADGSTVSLSRFDVAGVESPKGLKGYLYGERGVWRPGDSLFLNFVLEDKVGGLPSGHPLTLELTDPRGALQHRMVTTQQVGGVYPLHCATRANAPTGNWTAKVQVGGATFTKTLKIETVKPNRLKMDLDFGKKVLYAGDENLSGKLNVKWLHGAPGKNLKARVEVQVRAATTEFQNYKGWVFDDPARRFSSEPQVLYDGATDGTGNANVALQLTPGATAPGKLIANFKVRAFENSGDFSTDNFALDYYPYPRFTGVLIPTNKWGSKEIDANGGKIQVACLDAYGKPLAGKKLQVGLYRCDWRWWWDEDAQSGVAEFNSADHLNAINRATLTTDARGMAIWTINAARWGRYLVRVSDLEGGHSSGDFFWTGQPEQLDDMQSRNAAAMLPFSVEKEKYTVGEEVTLKVPASENGRILLTLESGARVIKHEWFEAKAGDNYLRFRAEENMAPAVYAHVSLLQPHAQTVNDLPIRLYGVLPVNIENPQTRLQPKLVMPDVVRPGEDFTVSVAESSGKACAYTLAIVDEGLLDLTRFQTPNPWDAFFAREALGVKTWDVYDYVLGAYGAGLERILSVGGDAINQKAKNGAQINRFKPVVRHLGPFYLQKGQTAKHTVKLDEYVGSVRAMLVCSAPAAGGKGAYGSAEKTAAVRKPLMVLPTLPRVLGPGETLRLPVDVFAMESKVKNATVTVKESSGLVSILGSSSTTVNFPQPGEEMTYFNLKVGNKTGVAKFTISAQGGGEKAVQNIEILVRNPNPTISRVWEGQLEPGQEWSAQYDPSKYTDLSAAVLEVSSLPPINLSRHLEYLLRYPHGCIEQTVSAVFPQLYVDVLTPLTQAQKDAVTKNMTAAIEKLRNYQSQTGGFAYWPGGNDINDWSNSYAGHFLLEAKNKGYAVPEDMLEKWLGFQVRAAKSWSPGGREPWQSYDSDLTQAYALYTLALAGKSDLAGMNRLKEKKDLYMQSAMLLAGAYARAGKPEAARDIIGKNWRQDWDYAWSGRTYGSNLRDRALMLETFTATGDTKRAQALVEKLCNDLGNQEGWQWNTQSLATALRALSAYAVKNMGASGSFAYRLGNGSYNKGDNSKPVSTVYFTQSAWSTNSVGVKNNSKAKLYARLVLSGQPLAGEETADAGNIALNVRYTDTKGNPVDVSKISQGSDFVAEVTVSREGSALQFPFNELALSQVFPSGWEILSSRLSGIETGGSSVSDYQDLRDDRVYTYFDMPWTPAPQQGSPSPTNKEVRTYRIQLNASYAGKYYLPAVNCQAMYDNRIRATVPGRWVEVI